MKPSTAIIQGVAAPLLERDIDTEALVRVVRLMQFRRGQLGPYLFEALRYHDDGSENPSFLLNNPPFRESAILLAGENFGCGSSREGAVWALMDFGIRCVIAPSFADIFYSNCVQNGLLPIILSADVISVMAGGIDAEHSIITINHEAHHVATSRGQQFPFTLNANIRERLLSGIDDVSRSLDLLPNIIRYRDEMRTITPWVFNV